MILFGKIVSELYANLFQWYVYNLYDKYIIVYVINTTI